MPPPQVEILMPAEDVKRFIRNIQIFEGWNVVGYGSKTVIAAHDIREHYHVRFRDALLAATMIESGIETIITENAHLRCIPGITVVNPYR